MIKAYLIDFAKEGVSPLGDLSLPCFKHIKMMLYIQEIVPSVLAKTAGQSLFYASEQL